ncbi:DUF2206 domain-containing protein [Actinoplanes solisilvae]|uniref:DUF2206 domain-containing protein n=1 Tax=Actinoplanes solisilvae TaxID=2486853 RepID=UPI000FD98143|nr:DUF2206 domain-containing protein [Actinoplanes solisilvae]
MTAAGRVALMPGLSSRDRLGGAPSPVPAGVAVVGLLLLNLIVLTGWPAPLRAVVGFPVAVVLPGALAMRALRISHRTVWNWLVCAVALSLAGLMGIGVLLGLLPGGGLTTIGCLLALDALIAALAVTVVLCERRWPVIETRPALRIVPSWDAGSRTGIVAVALGGAAVILTVLGALRLNAGESGALTTTGLVVAAAALTAAVMAGHRHHVTAAATAVYLVALAILLATSLRGIGVTGHDIKVEYRVFLNTLDSGTWEHPSKLFVGYNSCLSITVLPVFLARLLGLAALDVYRVCFQVLFAIVPVGVFLLTRRRLPGAAAVGTAVLFIAFPAFINDMPMLNRQEIALIFFVVLVGALLDVHGPRRQRTILFVIAAAGMAVSHYTSTYITAAVLMIGWAFRLLRRLPLPRADRPARPARGDLDLGRAAVVVTLAAVAWTGLSGSAATCANELIKAADAVIERASVNSESTRYSLIADKRPLTDSETLAKYAAAIRLGVSVPSGAPPPPECAPRVLPADTLGATGAGTALARAGLPPQQLNDVARAATVLLFQGGSVVGFAILWRRRRKTNGPLASLAAGSLALLVVAVVLPQLSDSYGLLRLYQQFLVLLAPLVMLSVIVPPTWLAARVPRVRRLTAAIAGTVAVGCLLITSGLIPQLVGGYTPQLHLNNAGPYFRAYYADDGDLGVARWMGRHLRPDAWVITDNRDTINLRSLTHLSPQEGLVPGAVPIDAYVSLTTVDGNTGLAVGVATFGERVLRYTFPVACVAAGRPLVYEAAQRRVYGPVEQR